MKDTERPGQSIALCSAIDLGAAAEGAEAPEWIHLLPEGEIRTADDRGPYLVRDMKALMARSLKSGDRLVLDSNHSTDLAAPRGEEAPARGWIVELQHRTDGLWGKVEWTEEGRKMVEAREYRGISPVIAYLKNKSVIAVRRASLVNQPNLQGLTALHQEEDNMDFMQTVAKALGLGDDADEEAILAAITKALDKSDGDEPKGLKEAVQSATSPIATALGLEEDADGEAILTSINQLSEEGDGKELTALQAQVKTLEDDAARTKAEHFVDGEIQAGRMGMKPQRDTYITMHMEDPKRTDALVKAMPMLKAGALPNRELADEEGAAVDPTQLAMQATQYQKKQADAGVTIDFGEAVAAVQEGKHK